METFVKLFGNFLVFFLDSCNFLSCLFPMRLLAVEFNPRSTAMSAKDSYAATARTGFVGDGVSRDRQSAAPVTHNHVFPLAHNLAHHAEPRSLERPNLALVRDAGDSHGLPLEDDFPLLQSAAQFVGHREVLINQWRRGYCLEPRPRLSLETRSPEVPAPTH